LFQTQENEEEERQEENDDNEGEDKQSLQFQAHFQGNSTEFSSYSFVLSTRNILSYQKRAH